MKTFVPINFCDGMYQNPAGEGRKADGLAVRLTSFCANSCSFCIAADTMKIHLRKNIDLLVAKTLESGARSLMVLGGEPLLFLDDALQLVNGVRDRMDYITFTTSLPITVDRQWDKFCQLMDSIDTLTVSLQSTDSVENDKILRNKKPHDVMSILGRVVDSYSDKIMVVLNLSQGGLDSRLKIMNALDDLNDIGVPFVRINELQKAGEVYVNFENLFPELELGSPFARGCKTELKDLYPGLRILLKRSCFLVEEGLDPTVEDLEKVQYRIDNPDVFSWQENNVIYEDGSLTEFWNT